MIDVLDYKPDYKRSLCKLYCTAHNIPLDYSLDLSDYLSDKSLYTTKLLIIDNRPRGYIIYSGSKLKAHKDRLSVDDIFIDKKYNNSANYHALIQSTKRKKLFQHYKVAGMYLANDQKSTDLISKLDLSLEKKLFEMKNHMDRQLSIPNNYNVYFSMFRKGYDEKRRMIIQNSIFKDTKDHVDCCIDDILYEEEQDYYLDDGCIFLNYNDKVIGYSQIILEKIPVERPYIVNFGIDNNFRGLGLSKPLLQYTLNVARQKGYDDTYITVDSENYRAYNLYKNAGFNKTSTLCHYLYKYK